MLIGIEGDEFDLLDVDTLEALLDYTLIVEMHLYPHLVEGGFESEKEMLKVASRYFAIEKLKGRFVGSNEFDYFYDNEKPLAFSENRLWADYWGLTMPRRMISLQMFKKLSMTTSLENFFS